MQRVYFIEIYGVTYTLQEQINIGLVDQQIKINPLRDVYCAIKKHKEDYYLQCLKQGVKINNNLLAENQNYILKNEDAITIYSEKILFHNDRTKALSSAFHYISNNYKIERVLHTQSHFTTLLAHWEHVDKPVIIKTLSSKDSEDIFVTNEFRRECRLARKMLNFENENVSKIIYVDSGMCPKYYVREYTWGSSIYDYITKNGSLSYLQAIQIILQLAQGLQSLHRDLEIIHRDLNPKNIMFGKNLAPKIVNIQSAKDSSLSTLTCKGSLKGMLLYSAPEIIKEGYSIQSDMYSLGLVFLFIVIGKHPIENINDLANFNFQNYQAQVSDIEMLKGLLGDLNDRFLNYDTLIKSLQEIENRLLTQRTKRVPVTNHTLEKPENLQSDSLDKVLQLEHNQNALQKSLQEMQIRVKYLEEQNQMLINIVKQLYYLRENSEVCLEKNVE